MNVARSSLVMAHNDGRHEPASHPVRRWKAARDRIDAAPLPPLSATATADLTARIDYLAQLVRLMPDVPLTVGQRSSIQIIARELLRRATNERS